MDTFKDLVRLFIMLIDIIITLPFMITGFIYERFLSAFRSGMIHSKSIDVWTSK